MPENTVPLSQSEKIPSLLEELIYTLKIRDVMTRELCTISRAETMRRAQALMKEHGLTALPVLENGRLFGIITVGDIIHALDNKIIEDKVEDQMTRNVIVLEDDMPLSLGITYFDRYHFRVFPVLDKNNKLVGIVTSRDIINKLLVEMNKEVAELEKLLPAPAQVNSYSVYKEFIHQKFSFEDAGVASGEFKKILQSKGFDAKLIRRVAVAAYELEMNLVIHSDGGKISMAVNGSSIEIAAKDRGPGIKDVALALQEGYSTANDWIRSLGFGAGMGLSNVRRVSDDFQIQSAPGKGTEVRAIINTGKENADENKRTGQTT
ncbi:MAG: CBS domain-containing protein [Candidatus Margulisbacteria bacterium]|jgi:CBS domain-containing protein/anti-sigma regulatory factor (Ser/Thr protein kinase)|nr:CBS domain-containing protein [Candidatus Margulisiibacteriota bacterium]